MIYLVTRTIYFTWRVVRGGELLRMSRACLREREERGRHPVIYTRDEDPLFYLEGGERRRAPENVQGLPEGEGGGVGTL